MEIHVGMSRKRAVEVFTPLMAQLLDAEIEAKKGKPGNFNFTIDAKVNTSLKNEEVELNFSNDDMENYENKNEIYVDVVER